MSTAKRFYEPETTWYSELLYDVARKQVIVGARWVPKLKNYITCKLSHIVLVKQKWNTHYE